MNYLSHSGHSLAFPVLHLGWKHDSVLNQMLCTDLNLLGWAETPWCAEMKPRVVMGWCTVELSIVRTQSHKELGTGIWRIYYIRILNLNLQLIKIFILILCSKSTGVLKMVCSVQHVKDLQGKICTALKTLLFRSATCLSTIFYQAAAYNTRAD